MKTQTLNAGERRPSAATTARSSNELVLSRLLDAPRELVWKAWTEPEHLVRWCAPHDFTITHCQGEARPGGAWRTCMVSPEGLEHWVGGVYREVAPVERLVFTHQWDDDGRPGPETLVTITLFEEGVQTRLHFLQQKFPSPSSRDGHEIGWSESFDRLNEHLHDLAGANSGWKSCSQN